jgi:hypothetical protein
MSVTALARVVISSGNGLDIRTEKNGSPAGLEIGFSMIFVRVIEENRTKKSDGQRQTISLFTYAACRPDQKQS